MRPAKANDEARTAQLLQRWAEGKATLREVRGYTDEELYAIAKVAYVYYFQGRIPEARTIFQGLYAVNPVEPYFAKALGVVEFAAGNPQGALAAWDVAIKLAPDDPAAWVGRAEVKLASNQRAQALEDLRRAAQVVTPEDPLKGKIFAMLAGLSRK
jgi:type III secretion system low calcium response chaperone LcrH/SycD